MTLANETNKLASEYLDESRKKLQANKLNEAALLAQNALHLFKSVCNYHMCASSLNVMGVICAESGNENMAVDCYLEGLACAVDHHFNDVIPLFYNNIGTRYQELHEHETAISYFLLAEKNLQSDECTTSPRYPIWCFVTMMNILSSYTALQEYELAEEYLNKTEAFSMYDDIEDGYLYSFLITKCNFYFGIGQTAYIEAHMDELLKKMPTSGSNFLQNTAGLCQLLKNMKQYDIWYQVLDIFQEYAKQQESVFFEMILAEHRIDYYQTIGDTEQYTKACVAHARLYLQQQKIHNKERADALTMKIELQNKEKECQDAEQKSYNDPLTGLGNRYLLHKDYPILLKSCLRSGERIGLGVIDIDLFKQHNDTYGHITGDECIKIVAATLTQEIGSLGKAYRFGGDEFLILLHTSDINDMKKMAQSIKEQLFTRVIFCAGLPVSDKITISQGYVYTAADETVNPAQLIELADQALYQVKRSGRDNYLILEK